MVVRIQLTTADEAVESDGKRKINAIFLLYVYKSVTDLSTRLHEHG